MKPVVLEEEQTLLAVLNFVTARKAGKPAELAVKSFGFTNSTLDDASWRTASATGALALMDYDEAQRYAGAYQLQEEVMRIERVTLDDFLELESYAVNGFDAAHVTPELAASAEPQVRVALSHLIAWQQFMAGLQANYVKALAGS